MMGNPDLSKGIENTFDAKGLHDNSRSLKRSFTQNLQNIGLFDNVFEKLFNDK
jgi:hypothetical protein